MRRRDIIIVCVLLIPLIAFAIIQIGFARTTSERRAWRTSAIDQISRDVADSDFSRSRVAEVQRIRDSEKRPDWWRADDFVLLKDGSWLTYRMRDRPTNPRKRNMSLFRASDGRWHVRNAAIDFGSDQPDSLESFVEQHQLTPMNSP